MLNMLKYFIELLFTTAKGPAVMDTGNFSNIHFIAKVKA